MTQMKSMAKEIQQVKVLIYTLRERLARLESGADQETPPESLPQSRPEPVVPVEAPLDVSPPPLPVAAISESEILPTPASPRPMEPKVPVGRSSDGREDRLSDLEKVLGLKWTTWVGAIILFLGAGLFVKYSFDRAWLGPWTKVGLSTLAGCAVLAAGEFGLRRHMIWLGQGLVGIGLAILYTAAFGAYAFYELVPHTVVFAVMMAVTVMGMGQAIRHNALSMAFLAVLGGFLTPLLLSTGANDRDALFAYILMLDLGVLAVAWFKRWRALDVLAFCGTLLLFMVWFLSDRQAARAAWVPTVLWLVAFYAVFLVVPFLYHLRRATPVTGERFFLAVTNALGLFSGLYAVLHAEHRMLLSVMTLGMSGTYLAMGLVIQHRIKEDTKAMIGCAALFVSLLTLAIPIALDLYGVTIAWAVEGPLLLFLAYLYPYKPVRVGAVVPWCLAVARLFVFHWPMHSQAFTLFLNPGFGTAVFVVLAGGAFAWLCHRYARDDDEVQAKRIVGLGAAFLALFLVHTELWLWLRFERHGVMQCWLTALVWTAGAAGFGGLCWRVRKAVWYWAGVAALGVSCILCLWAYSSGAGGVTHLLLNGRFMASCLMLCALTAFGFLSRSLDWRGRFKDVSLAERMYSLCALMAACLCHGELLFWLKAHDFDYAVRWALPWIWLLGGTGTLVLGQRFGLKILRSLVLVFAGVASIWVAWSFMERVYHPGWLFLNLRCATALAGVGLFMAYGFVLRQFEDLTVPDIAQSAFVTFVAAVILLFVALNAETYLFAIKSIHAVQQARWAAHMAISLVWGVYASGLLVFGFAKRVRVARLSALALYGVTALKLVFVDLAGVQEVFRIISFLVLGLLIIAASYLYHRAEKQLVCNKAPTDILQ
ncbi:MAG: DUF2339 domain-containing protein [Phycisphaerae bacterium]|nr:DUF2339 domain-containing protein [Phycisphaerae bacterium]